MSGSLPLEWVVREPPLAPAGLVALGPDATLLAERLAQLDASVTKHLSGVSFPPLTPTRRGENAESDSLLSPRLTGVRGEFPLLAVLGPHDWLPWSPGAVYLAPEPTAPALLLPTTQRPTLPPALVLAALTRRFPELRPPLVLLPNCCFSVAEAASLASLPASLPPAPSLPPDEVGFQGKGGGVRGGGLSSTPPLLPTKEETEGEGVAQ